MGNSFFQERQSQAHEIKIRKFQKCFGLSVYISLFFKTAFTRVFTAYLVIFIPSFGSIWQTSVSAINGSILTMVPSSYSSTKRSARCFEGFFLEFGVPVHETDAFNKSVSDENIQRVVAGCSEYGMIVKESGWYPALPYSPLFKFNQVKRDIEISHLFPCQRIGLPIKNYIKVAAR